jgi:hypothetical protein
MNIKQWIIDLFRDANNDADETVLYALSGVLTYNGLAIYSVVASATHAFDMQAYGIGFGAILAGIFAGYGLKAKMERKP